MEHVQRTFVNRSFKCVTKNYKISILPIYDGLVRVGVELMYLCW